MSTFGGSKWEEETQSSSCPLMDETPPPPHSDERNQRFKLIPRVIGGSWVIRKSVGSTPVLLGTKIHHRCVLPLRLKCVGEVPRNTSLLRECIPLNDNGRVDG